jgi:pimeloyl-ACP methyl ester carboxylesterase
MSVQAPRDRYVNIGGINTRYWAEGDSGSNVLLVHGLGGSVENWAPNIGPLSRYHRVFALDLLGFGRSDKLPIVRSIFDLVRFIGDFMQAMQIEKASLIGNSLGGGLALQFAIESPEKVTSLVLVDNAGMGRETIRDFKLVSIPLLGEILTRPSRKGMVGLWRKIVYDPSVITGELLDLTYDLATLPGARRALLSTLRAGIGFRGQRDKLTKALLEKIGTIAVPALIIWGRQDRILPVAHAEICRRRLPDSELHLFDNCGHMPQIEHPDEFNRLTLEFLARRAAPVEVKEKCSKI